MKGERGVFKTPAPPPKHTPIFKSRQQRNQEPDQEGGGNGRGAQSGKELRAERARGNLNGGIG